MDSRFCSCGVDTHACGQGHCRTHHRDYPVLNGGEGCPDCALDRNPLVNKLDELAKQFKAAEDTEINRLTAELSALRTAHDAAVEGRKMWQGVAEEAARQRDAALATGREQADALREMVELWERVHGTAIIGRPTVNAAKKALAAIPSTPNGCEWKKETPDEQALWWWWNEDGPPIPVSIMASGHENVRCFASQGQYGWNRAQWVEDMGGFWMKVVEPDPPISIKAEEGKP
jgi:hypothetical protein